MRKTLALLSTALLLGAAPASAHVKWFVSPGQAMAVPDLPPSWWGWAFGLGTLLAAVAVALALEKFAPPADREGVGALWPRAEKWTPLLLRLALATALLAASVQQVLLAPDLALPASALGQVLAAVQAAVALMLLADLPQLRAVTAWSLVGLFLAVLALAPITKVFEHLDLLGFAAFFMLVGDRPTRGLPYGILRTVVGVVLIALALNEKLADPAMSLAFLQQYHWNFVPGLSNALYVMGAGAVEMLVGLLLIAGLLPRFCGAAVLALMTLTMCLMGPGELVGHAPYMVLAFTLIVGEGGTRWGRTR